MSESRSAHARVKAREKERKRGKEKERKKKEKERENTKKRERGLQFVLKHVRHVQKFPATFNAYLWIKKLQNIKLRVGEFQYFFLFDIYIYIYIVIHRQICFVLSELISVARQYLPVAGIETRLTETPSQAFNHLATRRN